MHTLCTRQAWPLLQPHAPVDPHQAVGNRLPRRGQGGARLDRDPPSREDPASGPAVGSARRRCGPAAGVGSRVGNPALQLIVRLYKVVASNQQTLKGSLGIRLGQSDTMAPATRRQPLAGAATAEGSGQPSQAGSLSWGPRGFTGEFPSAGSFKGCRAASLVRAECFLHP